MEVLTNEIVTNWYSVTGSVFFGSAAESLYTIAGRGNLAVGFITPSVTAVVSLQVLYTSGVASIIEPFNKQPWAIIEIVSSSFAVAQFTGSTALFPGVAGFIPAPLVGTQNSYLRGDENWVSTNNGPTAAQYLFATSITNQIVGTAPIVIAYPALSNSTFSLLPVSNYKLSACIPFFSSNMNYRWFNVTTGTYIPGKGANNSGGTGVPQNMAYITTTVPTTVSLYASYGSGSLIYGQGFDNSFRGPWITTEMLSNNNTIQRSQGLLLLQMASLAISPLYLLELKIVIYGAMDNGCRQIMLLPRLNACMLRTQPQIYMPF